MKGEETSALISLDIIFAWKYSTGGLRMGNHSIQIYSSSVSKLFLLTGLHILPSTRKSVICIFSSSISCIIGTETQRLKRKFGNFKQQGTVIQ
ncbi:hypothetical protein LguiA_011159 [Lonicera macranthoides]